ncbi:hypothetical protein BJ875DRAFT_108124 [Amylocarpus encephaloides]|uniref:Uncharacterized protein n=1 Tax=Amylocarpus encephaloides TaxID=45428 RepID=A0A9P8C8J9_9HELO|nr:hypothetical protein BJ875DRAFT_108124 [Amylocarpus encephaloides]
MASRSFKPSYGPPSGDLASATPPKPSHLSRPSWTRSSSTSSARGTNHNHDHDHHNHDHHNHDHHNHDHHNHDHHNHDHHNHDHHNHDHHNHDHHNHDHHNHDHHNHDHHNHNHNTHNYNTHNNNNDTHNHNTHNYTPHNYNNDTHDHNTRTHRSHNDDDAVVATLRSLDIYDRGPSRERRDGSRERGRESLDGELEGSSPRGGVAGQNNTSQPRQNPDETPSRKRSKPIAIELPARSTPSTYTPLTGRGEKKGGYFPDYEDHLHQKYRPHPFVNTATGLSEPPANPSSGFSTPASPSNMSASSSQASPTSELTPRKTGLSPILNAIPHLPNRDAFAIPQGKYHPSNYVSPATAQASTARLGMAVAPLAGLQIPPFRGQSKSKRQGHERNNSDVNRKLQKYQRDMMAQTRQGSFCEPRQDLTMSTPVNPRLLPLGSPGPINTPLELEEDEADGYLAAGTRARGNGGVGLGLEFEREGNMVDSMIRAERSRMDQNTMP